MARLRLRRRESRVFITLLLALIVWCVPVAAQKTPKPKEGELLARVAAYIRRYVPQLINIVAEETFEQERKGNPPLRRRLLSDLLLVNLPGTANQWMIFRDVTAVDGEPVPDKSQRLVDLFVSPTGGSVEQANSIVRDGERFHLPGNVRTTNPLFMVVVLQERYQGQLNFDVGDEAPEFGPGVRVLHVEEPVFLYSKRKGEPQLFSLAGGRGRAWVDVATGSILQTEARLSSNRVAPTGIVSTTFAQNDRLGLLLPATMQTTWQDPSTRREVKGIATYSNYRRFEVKTNTTLELPPR